MIENLRDNIDKLDKLLSIIVNKKIDLNLGNDEVYSFKKRKLSYYKNEIESMIEKIKKNSKGIDDSGFLTNVKQIEKLFLTNQTEELSRCVKETKILAGMIRAPEATGMRIKTPTLPYEINDEVNADLKEVEKCFNVGSYRSTTILCGRILETALHRKYFEITGKDILETNPGIGLGKLIAKLKEKDVNFAPGVTEQIHLINQIRVFSVHKKPKIFYPSKQQTQAMILYTADILKKLFSKKYDL